MGEVRRGAGLGAKWDEARRDAGVWGSAGARRARKNDRPGTVVAWKRGE